MLSVEINSLKAITTLHMRLCEDFEEEGEPCRNDIFSDVKKDLLGLSSPRLMKEMTFRLPRDKLDCKMRFLKEI